MALRYAVALLLEQRLGGGGGAELSVSSMAPFILRPTIIAHFRAHVPPKHL
jgi:hypothetical protein